MCALRQERIISVKLLYNMVEGLILKMYCCPECGGSAVTWDRGLGKSVCPKDKTPVSEFRLLDNK